MVQQSFLVMFDPQVGQRVSKLANSPGWAHTVHLSSYLVPLSCKIF